MTTNLQLKISTKPAGFTMIEVILSIGIILILGSVGTVSLTNFRRNQQLSLAMSDMVHTLRRAQAASSAQENGNAWGVRFHNTPTGQDTFSLFYGNSFATGTLVSTRGLSTSLAFTNPSASTTKDIIFAKATGLPSASTTVTIALSASASVSQTITINTAGQISY